MRERLRSYTDDYRLHTEGGRQYLTFPQLDEYRELRHLFTTRHGGVSSGCVGTWNFGARDLDTPENVRRNYEFLADTLCLSPDRLVVSDQTHTVNIRQVTAADGGKGVTRPKDYRDVDGLVTNERQLALVTGHADCNAIFFFDPSKQVIGLAHSGWRGTLGGIGREMIRLMREKYGCSPADILAGVGPSLCQECFEVDPDVAQAFFDADASYRAFALRRGVKYHIDLKGIIRHDLLVCGLGEDHLMDMKLCTKCDTADFFSHRGQKGKRGIMAAAMVLI